MHYLITGHTGFKGSWLSLMLHIQGHTVSGISLNPEEMSMFSQTGIDNIFNHDFRLDIRNSEELQTAINEINPDVVIHLAAQPLVRESYRDPIGTFETNVIGTLNLLEACKELTNLKCILVVTTDKVYKNHNHLRGYIETDELGGDDPYSASKAAADIATQSWVKSYARFPVGIARAGNVIGGGDWAADRIIPDLVRALSVNEIVTLRYPKSIRPWQHVLDCLNGYLKLVEHLIDSGESGTWNFGPDLGSKMNVSELVSEFSKRYGKTGDFWRLDTGSHLQESNYLLLDSSKARKFLGWQDKFNIIDAVKFTAEWYQSVEAEGARATTERQIRIFNSMK